MHRQIIVLVGALVLLIASLGCGGDKQTGLPILVAGETNEVAVTTTNQPTVVTTTTVEESTPTADPTQVPTLAPTQELTTVPTEPAAEPTLVTEETNVPTAEPTQVSGCGLPGVDLKVVYDVGYVCIQTPVAGTTIPQDSVFVSLYDPSDTNTVYAWVVETWNAYNFRFACDAGHLAVMVYQDGQIDSVLTELARGAIC